MSDETRGGDPPCWAHLAGHPADIETVDLAEIASACDAGVIAWSLESEDLNVNVLVFGSGEGVPEHANAEVDVLLIGIAGEGVVTIDGRPQSFQAGQAILVPKDTKRSTKAVAERFSYLTCHRRRALLRPVVRGPAAET